MVQHLCGKVRFLSLMKIIYRSVVDQQSILIHEVKQDFARQPNEREGSEGKGATQSVAGQ